MRKIGVLYGMENTFPPALVERINGKGALGVTAEAIRIGSIKMAEPSGYAVLIDRISHDVEFYRAYLKNAALTGTAVMNDPIRAGAHDRFYGCALAASLGIAVPRAAIVPQKEHPSGTTVQSMRNLMFPLDWDEVFAYVGFPANFRAVKAGRWKGVTRVHSPTDFFPAYDQSGSAAMMLQAVIESNERYRCYVVGDQVRVIRYDPANAHGARYAPTAESENGTLRGDGLSAKLRRDAQAVSQGLGLDFSMVEFAIQEGIPYMVDLAHAAPEADAHSIGASHFEWLVETVAQLAIQKAVGEVRQVAARV